METEVWAETLGWIGGDKAERLEKNIPHIAKQRKLPWELPEGETLSGVRGEGERVHPGVDGALALAKGW